MPIVSTGAGLPVANRTSFATGQAKVAVPGTAIALSAVSVPIPAGFTVFLTFLKANTGVNVYVGNSKANAQTHTVAKLLNTSNSGIRLAATDVANIFIDADQANDGVDWIVEQ